MRIKKKDLENMRRFHHLFYGRDFTPEEFDDLFRACDALWLHSGNPKAPHAELTAGDCSDGFVNTLEVLKETTLCELLAGQLVRQIRKAYAGPVHWVIGSDHAGATLSYAVAVRFQAKHDFTEKGPNKTQLWQRFAIQPGEVVLQVEELVTTKATLVAVREGIRAGNPYPVTFAPLVATLVHRSDETEIEGSPILHARHYDIKKWKPVECPHCARGSKRLRPKHNWAELTQQAA